MQYHSSWWTNRNPVFLWCDQWTVSSCEEIFPVLYRRTCNKMLIICQSQSHLWFKVNPIFSATHFRAHSIVHSGCWILYFRTNSHGMTKFVEIFFWDYFVSKYSNPDVRFEWRYYLLNKMTSSIFPGYQPISVPVDLMFQVVSINECKSR